MENYKNKCLIQFTCASKYCKYYVPSNPDSEYKSTCASRGIYGDCHNEQAKTESFDRLTAEIERG